MTMSTDGRAEQLRALTRMLDEIVADRSILDALTLEERTRLLAAAGNVFHPDADARRRRIKELRRTEKSVKVEREQAALAGTGIRELRRRTVVHSPNVYAPTGPEQLAAQVGEELPPDPELDPGGGLHCYVCKQRYMAVHHFYDQLCPPCAELNFAKRAETADLRGRTALVTGGRVKIGYQT